MKLNRKVLLISLLMLIGASMVGYIFYMRNQKTEFNETTNQGNGAEKPESQDGTKLKEDGTLIPSTSPSNPTSASKQPAIVTLTVAEQSSSNATVRATVNQSGGTCRVIFEKSGYPNIERTAPVILAGQIYGCQGFDLPLSEFPAKGNWLVKVHYNSETAEGTSEIRSINLN